jgi:cell division protease FtsH
MAWLMDQEIQKIILDAESRSTEILAGKRHVLDALAEALMKEEILERADVERIIQGAKE